MWNPQGYGSPNLNGNSAAAYYPGDAYVDVVANDLYNIRRSATWDANDQLYAAHPPCLLQRPAQLALGHRAPSS